MNVYQALKVHCGETDDKLSEILSQVMQKGAPYLIYNKEREIDERRGNYIHSLAFWGINPTIARDIVNDDQNLTQLIDSENCHQYLRDDNISLSSEIAAELSNAVNPYFASIRQHGTTKVNAMFSKYKIQYYCSSYGIRLCDIPKFTETGENPGIFYQEYQKRINEMIDSDEQALTPHLDIHWHETLPHLFK